jgi:hypothetical protein
MTSTTKTFRTVNDVREEKRFAEALADELNTARVRIERDRQKYIASRLAQYPQIGVLNGEKFYAYVGAERRYVESKFLNSIILEIELG